MAQILELLGDYPLEAKMGGKYSRDLFDHIGMSCPTAVHLYECSFSCFTRQSTIYQNPQALAAETSNGGKVPFQRRRL